MVRQARPGPSDEGDTLKRLNEHLAEAGMPRIAIVHPDECKPQELNARYMNQQTMANLVANVQRDGRLESVPLCAVVDGKLEIVSGHHRVEAAKTAKLDRIMVLVIDVADHQELVAKQLSHNALEGQDDEAMLAKMYAEIADLELKYYSGLRDQLDPMDFTSLNFKAGDFHELTMAFLPEDTENLDRALEIIDQTTIKSATQVRMAGLSTWPIFAQALRKLKRTENIKSNAAAVCRMAELAIERLAELSDGETRATVQAAGQPSDSQVPDPGV